MTKPAETKVFEFLEEQIAAAAPDHVLAFLELHDTVYQKIRTARGIRISDCVSEFAPYGDDEKEWDAQITLSCYIRVEGKDKTDRQPALAAVFDLQREVYRILRANPTLNDRVCDVLLRPGSRGYDSLDGEPYAVAMVPLIVNPTGGRYTE